MKFNKDNTMENDAMVLVGYPHHYKATAASNYYAFLTNARAYKAIDAANKVDAFEIIRANFGDCEIIDKAVS